MFAIDGPTGKLAVARSPDNGGDLSYETVDALEKDFANGSLHPGDLKAAVAGTMVSVLEQISLAMKQTETAKAVKDLKNYQKRALKNKK